jgi:hypothetical protein
VLDELEAAHPRERETDDQSVQLGPSQFEAGRAYGPTPHRDAGPSADADRQPEEWSDRIRRESSPNPTHWTDQVAGAAITAGSRARSSAFGICTSGASSAYDTAVTMRVSNLEPIKPPKMTSASG